jgi:hypothetical protein
MFIVESQSSRAARKMSFLMMALFVVTASFGALLTMHFFKNPSLPSPTGFRILGFPRTKR